MKTQLLLLVYLLFSFLPLYGQETQSELELTKIANEMLKPEQNTAFLNTLKPSTDDLQHIFLTTSQVGDAWMHCEYVYSNLDDGFITSKKADSELKIHRITGGELKAGNPHSLHPDYSSIRDVFKDNLTLFYVTYTSADGKQELLEVFFKLNHKWVWIPNLYEAFELN